MEKVSYVCDSLEKMPCTVITSVHFSCKCQAIPLMLEIVFLLALLLQQQKVCFLACLYPHLWILFIYRMRKCFPMFDLMFQFFYVYIYYGKDVNTLYQVAVKYNDIIEPLQI